MINEDGVYVPEPDDDSLVAVDNARGTPTGESLEAADAADGETLAQDEDAAAGGDGGEQEDSGDDAAAVRNGGQPVDEEIDQFPPSEGSGSGSGSSSGSAAAADVAAAEAAAMMEIAASELDQDGDAVMESKQVVAGAAGESKQVRQPEDDSAAEYAAAQPLTKGDLRRAYFRELYRAATARSKLSKMNKDFGWNMGENFFRGFLPDQLALVDRIMGQVYYVTKNPPEDEKFVITWSPQKKIKPDYSFVPKLIPLGGTYMRWVTPILTVQFANMGMGNWKGVERERDRMYSKKDPEQAEMSIGFGAEPIDAKLVDPRTGQSLDALQYFKFVHHLMKSFAVIIVNNNLKPLWIAGCCDDIEAPQRILLAKQRAQRLAALKKQVTGKKITPAEANLEEARIMEETDEKNATATLEEVVQVFMRKHMTDPVKLKSTDPTRRDAPRIPFTENVSYTRDMVRHQYTSEKQSNQPYVPPNEDFENLFKERQLVYNPPKWVNLANWGKPGSDKAVSGVSIYDMNIWQGDRLALEISFDMFMNSPQNTCGFKTTFETIYFYSKGKGGGGNNPTPEVIPDEIRRPIDGAEPFVLGNRNPVLYMQVAAPVDLEYVTFVAPKLGIQAPESEVKEAKGQPQQPRQPARLAAPAPENKAAAAAAGVGQKRKDPPAAVAGDHQVDRVPLSNAQRLARQNGPVLHRGSTTAAAAAAGGEHKEFGAAAMMSISAAVDASSQPPPPLKSGADVSRALNGEPATKKQRNVGPPLPQAVAPAPAAPAPAPAQPPARAAAPVRSLAADMAVLTGGNTATTSGKEAKVQAPKAVAVSALPKVAAAATTAAATAAAAAASAKKLATTAWHLGTTTSPAKKVVQFAKGT